MLSDNSNTITAYPLLPFSQLVYDMTRWMPSVYTFSQDFVMRGGIAEKQHIEDALRQALNNHPVFRMRINRHGLHYEAPIGDILHGKYHDAKIWIQGTDLYLRFSFNRILGDGKSLMILAEDFTRAYKGESLEPDNYWDYLTQIEQTKNDRHYNDSKAWLEHEFADTAIPVHPKTDRCCLFTLFPPKAGVFTDDYSDIRGKIQALSDKEHLSLDGFFSLCTTLAIAEYCHTGQAALTWAYEGRETPEEQRIFGSLHRDVPFQITRSDDRQTLIRKARQQIRSGIAHSDYPYTLTAPHCKRWNYAVNIIRNEVFETLAKQLPPNLEILPAQPLKTAYALLDIEISEPDERMILTFRYSATHYKQDSIRRFAALIHHYAEWLTD